MTMKKEELKCFICGQALELVDASAQKEHMDYGRHNAVRFLMSAVNVNNLSTNAL